MHIKRLKLTGFKSFVEPADLRIEAGLTGVVGPNGCGKSNLLEAIRWAMGESSPKSLRGGGMDDVIFAGTASRPARDFAEVSMLIERDGDPDGAASESEVTRRIERGAGSAYRIDGRDVRAKDVALLFADAATGAHSPALVSQGRIGAVIAAKPAERRALLEEAAGISGLHVRRKDAEQRLRATETNLSRLAEIVADQEQRAAQLRRQARAAERYRKLTAEIRIVHARLLYARWLEAEQAAQASDEEARIANEQVARINEAIHHARTAHDEAAAELTARRCALTELREEAHLLAHKLAAARARRDTITRRLTELDRLDGSLEMDIEREEALRNDAIQAMAALELERTAITRRVEGSEARSARVAAELNAAETVSREAEASLADLLARDAAMRAERRVAEASCDAAKTQLARTEQERGRLAGQLAALGGGDAYREAREAANASAGMATTALATAEQRRVEAEQHRAAAAEARDAAETVLAAARAALAAAKSEHDALAQALENGKGHAIAALKAAPGYEHALAAALGDDAYAPIDREGRRRWEGSEARAEDPLLAAGLECLAAHVSAPAELQRRLMQVAVVDVDCGQPLAVGQRLVTREGQLRRWDGFVVTGAGAAVAERLLRANRRAELAAQLPRLEDAVGRAGAEREQALTQMESWRESAEQERLAALAAERVHRDASRAIDTAIAALERLEAQRAALEQRQEDLAPLRQAAAEAWRAAQATLAALPDPAALEQEINQLRMSAADAASVVAEKRAEAATRARETAADRERSGTAAKEQAEWRRRQNEAEQRLRAGLERRQQQAAERADLEREPLALDPAIVALERASDESEVRVAEAAAAERDAENLVAAAAQGVSTSNESFAEIRERRAAASARAEAYQTRSAEIVQQSLEKFECVPQRLAESMGFAAEANGDPHEQAARLDRLSTERERIGPVNLVAEAELAEVDLARNNGAREAEELTQAIHRLRGSIGNLNREGRVRLLSAYDNVDAHFRRLFRTLFEGGQAHLELVESDDPLEAGLEIMAQPPGKRLSALTLLSGGEQALTAIALIFAIFLTNPAPICVLDEVDAPLDDANVERFCELLQQMARETDTRYLIVTHNAVTMSRMDRLYGVTMIEKGVSRLVSVDLGSAATLLAAE